MILLLIVLLILMLMSRLYSTVKPCLKAHQLALRGLTRNQRL